LHLKKIPPMPVTFFEVYPILRPLMKEIKVDNLVRFPSFV
jgi:hypothetical protein